MNKQDIRNYNSNGAYHGYQEWYVISYCDDINVNGLYVRGHFKYNKPTGYIEFYQIKEMRFYIN